LRWVMTSQRDSTRLEDDARIDRSISRAGMIAARATTRARTVASGSSSSGSSDGLRRAPSTRRGPRRKIVPIPSARDSESSSAANKGSVVGDDDDDDEPLEYASEYRASGDASGDASSSNGDGGRRRRGVSATERTKEDATHAAFIAPRLAIGIASDAMDRLSKGPEEGFADVMDFVRGLGSSTDALGDVLRRTEEEIDRLESIGVRASAPVREAVRGVVPEEIYGKYLEPAVEYAENEEGTDRGVSSNGGVNHDGEEFDDDAVNAAADAVAAAMSGINLGESSSSSSNTTTTTTKNGASSARAPDSFEESVENMVADAVMSSSTVSASYSAPEGMPYGADAPKVDSSATTTESSSDARETKPASPEKSSSTAPFAATVGYWRKINAECPDEEPLMDIMDMNIVFRQAAVLLNYLRIEQPTSTTWSVASNAGIIQIAESYPIDGSSAVVSRRDLRSGDQIGSVSVTTADPDAVRLESSWSAPLAGSQVETFRVDASGVLVRVVEISLENGESWSGTYRYSRA